MGEITTYTFDNAGNYSFDSNLVEVSGGAARLKKIANPGLIFNQDFASATGFVYNAAKAEFAAGLVRQKDQTAANSIFAGKMATKDLNWNKSGGLTGTLNGTPTFTGGKMTCLNTQGVYYAFTTLSISTHKFKYTPNYSTGPSTNRNIISCWNGTNNNDRFDLFNSPSGNNIRINIYDSAGVSKSTATIGAWNPTLGVEYEFELNINSTNGNTRLFINGVLLGTVTIAAWARGGIVSRLYLGASPSVYNTANGKYDDYITFSTVQHTTNYTPGYTPVNAIYLETRVDLPQFIYTDPVGGIQAWTNFFTTEVFGPKYIMNGLYWAGLSWDASDGSYAQSSSATEVFANLATLNAADTMDVFAVLPDSNTLSSISDLTVEYTGQIYSNANPTIEVNSGIYCDNVEDVIATLAALVGDDNVTFVTKVDSVYYYVNASAPAITDGNTYAESNILADWAPIWAAWDPAGGVTIKIKMFLHSGDQTTTPEIQELTVEWNFNGDPIDVVDTCIVWGYSLDALGDPNLDAITVRLKQQNVKYKDNIHMESKLISVTPRALDGYWEVAIADNDNMTEPVGASYIFDVGGIEYDRVVPDLATCLFWDLVAP